MPGLSNVTGAPVSPMRNGFTNGKTSQAARSLDGISNRGQAVGYPNHSGTKNTLLSMVGASFDKQGSHTLNLRGNSTLCDGASELRPEAMHGDDGTCADAHSSAASHALNVGLGNDAPAQRVAALQARLAGLANEKAGVDLTTAGLVLQVADHRRASGASIDTSAVEKTLGKVVKRLEAMGLSEAGRGYYDGTRDYR